MRFLNFKSPFWVVVDGSTDGSDLFLENRSHSSLQSIRLPRNKGKGEAVLQGMQEAHRKGFTHALVMDSDGQHPVDSVKPFFEYQKQQPRHLILGEPIFGKEAPWIRRWGHSIANFWVRLETQGHEIHDSLFGFRIYPLADSLEILQKTNRGRGYDFETELAVRLVWKGYTPHNVPVPVRYFSKDQGGVSHFRYLKDNLLLIRCHLRLLWNLLIRSVRSR